MSTDPRDDAPDPLIALTLRTRIAAQRERNRKTIADADRASRWLGLCIAQADYAADHLAQLRRERAAARGPILRPRPVGRER